MSFEGTTTKLNRAPETGTAAPVPAWFPIAATQLTADGAVNVVGTPLEAVRPVFAAQTGITTVNIVQGGDC